MTIIHADRKGLTNYDQCKQIAQDDRFIHAIYVDGTNKIIGAYENADRAREVFSELCNHLFEWTISVENIENWNVFYMPEE